MLGQGQEGGGDIWAAGRVAAHQQDGVVAGNGAETVGQGGMVDGGGEELRRSGRSAQHDEIRGGVGADEQLAGDAEQAARPPQRDSAGASLGVASPPSAGTA